MTGLAPPLVLRPSCFAEPGLTAPRRAHMADFFVSYTFSDRDWAFWVAKELEALGHTTHIHEWEVQGGDDIYAWMEKRHDAADRVLCVVSDAYLRAPYSTLERNAAQWQAASKRPGFVLFVVVQPCRLPTLADHLRRCELFGVPEEAARLRKGAPWLKTTLVQCACRHPQKGQLPSGSVPALAPPPRPQERRLR